MNALSTIQEALAATVGRRVVFTNGVFDILHAGHVMCLSQARALGDFLVVGVNSDESARRLGKGTNRPINTLADRAIVLAGLRAVDYVVAFDEDTPEQTIGALQPAIHVKGGDYDAETLPETTLVRLYGGQVVIIPLLQGRSTTSILKKLSSEIED